MADLQERKRKAVLNSLKQLGIATGGVLAVGRQVGMSENDLRLLLKVFLASSLMYGFYMRQWEVEEEPVSAVN